MKYFAISSYKGKLKKYNYLKFLKLHRLIYEWKKMNESYYSLLRHEY